MALRNPFRINKVTMALLAVFLGLFVLGAAKCAKADEPLLTVEGGVAVVRGSTPALRLSVEWPNAGPRDADFQCGLSVIGPYDFQGANANQAVFDCLLVTKLGPLNLGLGPAFLQNVDQINGSHFNFALLARYQFNDRWLLAWHHWSNAGTKPPNYGRDVLVLGYRF